MKNAIYNVIHLAFKKNITTISALDSTPYIKDLYFTCCQEYAKLALKPGATSPRNIRLNRALGYDTNMDDLITDSCIKLFLKFPYLVKKYVALNEAPENYSSEEKINRFNSILNSIISTLLLDSYNKISIKTEYEEYDSMGNKRKIKRKSIPNTISLETNQNKSSDSNNIICLKDSLSSSAVSTEKRILSREAIMNYLNLYENDPQEFLNILSIGLGIKNSDFKKILEMNSRKLVFNTFIKYFSSRYDVPSALKYIDFFTEEELTYTGVIESSKQISNSRSACKTRLANYRKYSNT